jgi:hypothetical protein
VLKTILILGANSDVAKQCIKLYLKGGCKVIAASRNTVSLQKFVEKERLNPSSVEVVFFDAEDFSSHLSFYNNLHCKPNVVVYAAGFLVQNTIALQDFQATFKMMKTNYAGAVSILNIIAMDKSNENLERIIGLSSLSGVRGRKSNFIYGSTKSAFTQYLAGLRQELSARKIIVNALVIGYIDTKINAGLTLNKSLLMQPDYVARFIVNAGNSFEIIPNWKWKIIYWILKFSPEFVVSKFP